MATEQIEEYLETIGRLEERGDRVTTSSLASALRVSAPSVSEMLARLAERRLIDYRPRGEINLTDDGRTLARSVMRRHRLWERFLHDVLGLQWDSVHDEACRLEHATSPLVERELARAVGDNLTCPHGQAIPTPDGDIPREPSVPLLDLEPSQAARVVSVAEEDPFLLRKLEQLGIEPGEMIELRALDLTAGQALLRRGDAELSAPIEVVRAVRVAPDGLGAWARSVSLVQLAPGESGIVDRLDHGKTFAARCLALGFTPGTPIMMVHNRKHGPLIVKLRDARVALGRGEAQKIQVLRKVPRDGVNGETQ